MGRHHYRVAILLGLLLPLLAREAFAQPELWSTTSNRVVITDVTTGAVSQQFSAPPGVCIGRGDMSADRRSYFVPVVFHPTYPSGTGALVRIDTTTRQIVEMVPTLLPNSYVLDCGWVAVSPSDRWWHLWWVNSHITFVSIPEVDAINAITRTVSSRDTSNPSRLTVTFDPQGLRRFELKSFGTSPTLFAYADGSINALWQARPFVTGNAAVAAGLNGVYLAWTTFFTDVGYTTTLLRLDAATGAELARVSLAAPGDGKSVAIYNGRVFLSAGGNSRQMLASFDELTLAPGSSLTVNGTDVAGDLHFDPPANVGYWQRRSCDSASVCTDYLQPFDPDTLTLGPLRQTAAPVAGGRLGETRPPGRVTLVDASSTNGQVALVWQPDPSAAAPTQFEIWGARRGSPPARVAVVDQATRRWSSPLVPPGSYTVDVVARNRIGSAPPARVEISVNEPTIPLPPGNLNAETTDQAIRLTWEPAASGAAPANYVIEAAAGHSSPFGVIGSATLPRFFMTRAPVGFRLLRVRAVTAGGSSAPSNETSATTFHLCAGFAPPSAPSGLAPLIAGNIVTLKWAPPSTGDALEYVIEAGSNAGLSDLARLPIITGTTSFEVAAPSGIYVARVRARNACGDSAASNEVVVRAP